MIYIYSIMTYAQIQVLLIFFLPLMMYLIIKFIPVHDRIKKRKIDAFMRFAVLFTYAPILFILFGLIRSGFDTMAVLDGETVYTIMMSITIMFGIIMFIGAAIAKGIYFLVK